MTFNNNLWVWFDVCRFYGDSLNRGESFLWGRYIIPISAHQNKDSDAMAFFNLTQLGAQDPFKTASSSNSLSPEAAHAQITQKKPISTEAQASGSTSPSTTGEERPEKSELEVV